MTIYKKSEGTIPVLMFKDGEDWDAWLAKKYDSSTGVCLRLAKKSATIQTVSYPEVLDVALCHGWIGAQRKKCDDESFLQKFTPRGPKSIWSKVNRAKALELIENGRMQAGGLAAIAKAKADGRWGAAY